MHALVVARSTFPIQKCKKLTVSDHFLKFEMSQKWTPLWREARFQVKMYKAHHVHTTFGSWDVEKVYAVVLRRDQVKMHETPHVRTTFDGSDVVLRGRRKGLWTLPKVSKTWRLCSNINYNHQYTLLHHTTLHSTTPHYTTLHSTPHHTTLHYTTPHSPPPHSTPLRYITLHYATLNCATLHYTYNNNHNYNYATLHYTTLDYTTLHYPILLPYITYTRPITPLQYDCNYTTLITLHHNYNSTALQQLHCATTTTTAAVHHTTSSSCGWGDHCNHCNHSNQHNSNHLSVNQWIRSAIHESQQPTSPIGLLFWNFRHRLVRYYW